MSSFVRPRKHARHAKPSKAAPVMAAAGLSASFVAADAAAFAGGASAATADDFARLRQCESGGNYGVYNSGGSGAAGAYQFLPGTWNSIASSSGRSDLVGVDPARAAPADQDAMASALYAQQGSAPWGGAC